MAVLAAAMLVADLYLDPLYPFLLLVILLLAVAACTELHRLLQVVPHRPPFWLCIGGVFAVLLANWPVHILDYFLGGAGLAEEKFGLDPWQFVTFTFAAVAMTAFVAEMPRYKRFVRGRAAHRPGAVVRRLSGSVAELPGAAALAAAAVRCRCAWPSSCRSSATWPPTSPAASWAGIA